MPPFVLDALLFVAGCCCGVLVNWAIYRLAIIHPSYTSPLSRFRRVEFRWFDCIPVLGWLFQRRRTPTRGAGFWFRPLAIELSCGLALPVLLHGIRGGMLTSSVHFAVPAPSSLQQATWLIFFYTLLLLLTAATFIDFDEKTIPDEITLIGTLFALLIAYVAPLSRLPNVDVLANAPQLHALHFASPAELPTWHRGGWGAAAAMAIIWIWMFALLPKTITWRRGLTRGMQFLWASLWRRNRKVFVVHSEAPPMSLVNRNSICVLGVLLTGCTAAAWSIGGTGWDNLFSAWLGLAFGGGLVWAVRIIAGGALGKEAMGFGDVTLMAMIGAWLGWQPALLVFAIAPFAALFIAVAQLLALRHTEIAFGPYLSLGAVIVVSSWGPIWHDWAKLGAFALGPALLGITLACLVLMAAMLGGWRAIKYRWIGIGD